MISKLITKHPHKECVDALCLVIRLNLLDIAKLFVQGNADFAQYNYISNVLAYAIIHGSNEMCLFLLSYSNLGDIKYLMGRACAYDRPEIVLALAKQKSMLPNYNIAINNNARQILTHQELLSFYPVASEDLYEALIKETMYDLLPTLFSYCSSQFGDTFKMKFMQKAITQDAPSNFIHWMLQYTNFSLQQKTSLLDYAIAYSDYECAELILMTQYGARSENACASADVLLQRAKTESLRIFLLCHANSSQWIRAHSPTQKSVFLLVLCKHIAQLMLSTFSDIKDIVYEIMLYYQMDIGHIHYAPTTNEFQRVWRLFFF